MSCFRLRIVPSYLIFSVVTLSMSFKSCLFDSANSSLVELDATEIACVYRPYSTPNVCVKPTPLAANCSVKGCREQPLLFLFVGCGM